MTMINGNLKTRETIEGGLDTRFSMSGNMTAGVGGTSDYNELDNKPSINGVTLEGNVSGFDLGIYPPVNYSTTPQNTHIKWLDGKDIWQRVFEIDYPQGVGYHLIDTDILNYADSVISMTGYADYRSSGQNYQYNIPYCSGSSSAMFVYDYTGLSFYVVNDNFSGYKIYCVVRYTMQ